MRVAHRALVGAQEPALDQGGDPVDRWEQIVGILPPSPRRPLAAPVVDVAELLESVVAQPAVRDDTGARLYVSGDEEV